MLFYNGLEAIIFNRYQLLKCDELVILSGYVGPAPVHKLKELPIKTTVIYGMYGSDGIQRGLHQALVNENNTVPNIDVLYSTAPVHAKCYIWKYKGEVVHALIGSANFSTNGLTTPFKETLAETTADTFDPLNEYLQLVLCRSIPCDQAVVSQNRRRKKTEDNNVEYDKDICKMPLYIVENGTKIVPASSGLNWGMAKLTGSHVNINDAYIRIGADLIEHYPDLFPKKQDSPTDDSQTGRKGHRHNDNIDIIWDDGTTMQGLLEGTIPKIIDGEKCNYPKQIATTPSKALLGAYLRKRLGVPEGKAITMKDFQRYGRDTIDVSLQGEGIYYFDFSVVVNSNTQPILIENYHSPVSNNHSMVAESSKDYGRKNTVTCKHCGKQYSQKRSRQLVGHREKEDDICPYCNQSNGASMEWEYDNKKIEND